MQQTTPDPDRFNERYDPTPGGRWVGGVWYDADDLPTADELEAEDRRIAREASRQRDR